MRSRHSFDINRASGSSLLTRALMELEPALIGGLEVILKEVRGRYWIGQSFTKFDRERARVGIEQLRLSIAGEDLGSSASARADEIKPRNQRRLDNREGKIFQATGYRYQHVGHVSRHIVLRRYAVEVAQVGHWQTDARKLVTNLFDRARDVFVAQQNNLLERIQGLGRLTRQML